jgi:hypothetical protein
LSKFGINTAGLQNQNGFNGGAVYGPFGGSQQGHGFGLFPGGSGIFPPELEQKASVILPLAGAALLGIFKFFILLKKLKIIKNKFINTGIATYALVTSPAIATGPILGKRRKRSLFDEKIEQHMAYRAHKKTRNM